MVTRRPELRLIRGGKYTDEQATVRRLYPYEGRRVKAEPKQDPTPPRAA